MPGRISLVTLGVADVARSTAFYEALGWRRSSASVEGSVTFFNTDGPVLSLFAHGDLADDVGVAPGDGADGPDGAGRFRSVTLAINLDDPAAVDDAYRSWIAAGGRAVLAPEPVFWGGYRGYVADPDGHLWELAHNPGFTRAMVEVERAPD